ncbi:probable serine/threonine-protein kinase cdc7 [Calliphora vicina]|uniref:probable serine/threonine-protein kinase cdc7 n=1 Tax=Calliphora vicina TaxID=7373 RepID=UPI00325A6252
MVLTNFELWAADGSSGSNLPLDFESNNPHTRHLNPFDPRVVPQLNSNLNNLSSNGYYGFSYVNAAHDNNNNNNNNNNITTNNNNSTTYNFMANNDVNGMKNTFKTTTPTTTTRCKKRFFVMNDDVGAAAADAVGDCSAANNNNKNFYSNNYEVSAKRCRFDDDFSAQYCNDFFQLPSTQIATQSCLMDTEEGFENNNNNNNNNNNIEKYEQQTLNPQLQTLTAHQQQPQQQQNSQQQLPSQQQHQPQQQQHLYHQQQHYQDIQFATIKCHFNHNNNYCDTLALNSHTCKIDLEKNTENVLKIHKPNPNNSIQSENDKYDNDVANDFKVDDATLFAQLHGGCLHHHDHHQFNSTVVSSRGDYTVKNYPMNHHLQDENYYEEF